MCKWVNRVHLSVLYKSIYHAYEKKILTYENKH